MPDFRSFCRPSEREPSEIVLSKDETHHLVTVNRARVGDTVVAFDGEGSEWICECRSDARSGAILKVRFHQQISPLPYKVTLAQAIPKGKYMESIVKKATEIGVSAIVPLTSDRTQVHLDSGREENKLEKWRLAAIEAAKQCGNAFIPQIHPLQTASDFMQASGDGFDLKLIASLQPGAKSLKTELARFLADRQDRPASVAWMVGPEGDFTPAEMSLSKSTGFEPITLGPLVLRCETAAIYALSILTYELQNLPAAD